jgi:protein-disulfide isomerase
LNKYFRIAALSAAASMLSLALAAQTPAAIPSAPGAPAAQTPPANPFPPVNPKFFTATSPTVETVNSFLTQLWGFDPNRQWQVAAILSTNAPGVAKIVVFVGDKSQPGKSQTTVFFSTPDGKHAIADNVIAFGAKPFEDTRRVLQARADGPARGAASKDLLLVEFTDLQCPHCKDAQPTMDQLVTDFPQARVVFENFPLEDIHPYAFQAAAEGMCVRKEKGDDAFVKYVQAVFDAQGALTAESVNATLDLAVTKAGADPAAALACAKTQATIDAVKASVQLGKDLGVDSTPMLFVNGQPIPLTGVPYEVLKRIVVYRAGLDGVQVKLQPSLKTLK